MSRDAMIKVVARVLFAEYDCGEYRPTIEDDLAAGVEEPALFRRSGARAQSWVEAERVVDALMAAGCVPPDTLTALLQRAIDTIDPGTNHVLCEAVHEADANWSMPHCRVGDRDCWIVAARQALSAVSGEDTTTP